MGWTASFTADCRRSAAWTRRGTLPGPLRRTSTGGGCRRIERHLATLAWAA
jgi:hypothetical protein